MNLPIWVSTDATRGTITFGFRSMTEAEAFIKSQASNPDWWSQFTFKIEKLYGDLTVTVTGPLNLTFHFNKA